MNINEQEMGLQIFVNQGLSLAKILVNAAAVGAAIATILGLGGSFWWIFELLDHPRLQYCLILAIALVVGGISHQKWSFIWCLPLVLNLVFILPLFLPPAGGLPASHKADEPSHIEQLSSFNQKSHLLSNSTLSMIHANLDRHNVQPERVIQYLENQDVDLIFLQEVTQKWLTTLESEVKRYRVHTALPLENTQGVAMLVPLSPLKSVEVFTTEIIHLPSKSERPMIEVILRWQDQEVAILSMSTTRPRNAGTSAFQQIEFDAVANWSQTQQEKETREVGVIGDFNTTPWSGRFRKFLQDSQLRNSQVGFGLQPTWLAGLPSPMMIPIDHCLHSDSIRIINRAIGPNIGSDHLPLFVNFVKL